MPTILVVEDDWATAEFLDLALWEAGYTVVHAATGETALLLIVTTHPDLVLSDLHLPGMDGYRLCQRLAADPHVAAIPRVLMSAGDHRTAHLLGITAFLAKPFTLTTLLRTMRRHIH